MKITLFAGDYAYSSWSLRGWLLIDAFMARPALRFARFNSPEFETLRSEMAPSRTVPAARIVGDDGEAILVWDSLAMAETLNDYAPDAGFWPSARPARALARSIAAEMHSSFGALRRECPMNMRRTYDGFAVSAEVAADLERITGLWAEARGMSDGTGPCLFGAFGAVDAFFAPVASRIATYALPVDADAAAYVAALLGHPSVRRWRSMARADTFVQPHYEFGLPERPDPFAPATVGVPVGGVTPVNAACPYSGRPVAPDSVMQVGSRAIGFCNPFCRDKSAADPLAWPEVGALLEDTPAAHA